MKKLAILYSEYSPVIDAIICQLEDIVEVDSFRNLPENYQIYDLVVSVNYRGEENIKLLKCHHSLLPSFNSDEPVKDAFLAGVKVTGITVYFTKPERIIAQYPLFRGMAINNRLIPRIWLWFGDITTATIIVLICVILSKLFIL